MFPVLLAEPAEAPSAPTGVSVRAWNLHGIRHVLAVNGTDEPKTFAPSADVPPVILAPGEHRFMR